MWLYIKNSLIDCVLCIIASTCLAYTACSGFYSTQLYQDVLGTVLTAALCAALSLGLFAATLNRRTSFIGVPVVVAVIVAALVASVATSSVSNPADDAVGNHLYYAGCIILPTLATFLLSRRRTGCLALIVIGVLLGGLIEYLYWYGHVVAFLVFLIAAALLYIYRVYQVSLLDSESEALAFVPVTAAGFAICAVAVLAGFGLFTGVIAPLQPPSMTVKLVTEHYRANELEVRGIGSNDDAPDDQEQTDDQDDNVIQSSDAGDANALQDEGAGQSPLDMLSPTNENSFLGRLGAGLASLSLIFPVWTPLALIVGIALFIALLIVLKKVLRKRRFDKMVARGPDVAVRDLYLFFLDRFGRFKIPQPETMTLAEYASNFSDTFSKFEQRIDEPEFAKLTEVYASRVYGGVPATKDDQALFEEYYRKFYKWACGYVGKLRYCRMFFRV